MKFEQLEQFIKVIDEGSISKAATKLHMAQSTLSTSIKKFEEEIGCELMIRRSKGVELTSKGLEVYNQGRSICHQVEELKKSIEKDYTATKNLSVANNYSVIGKDIFIDIYNKYYRSGGRFRIYDCSAHETIHTVASGEREVGLIRFPQENKASHLREMKRKGLEYKHIATKVLCAVVGEKNPFYRLGVKSITIEQLSNFSFVGYYAEETELVYERILPRKDRLRENVSIGGVEHLKEIIRRTDAFTLDVYKEKDFNSERGEEIKYIPLSPAIYCDFGWIVKKDRKMTDIAKEYIEKIEGHFKKYKKSPYEK